jgi:hypothetical protein
MRQCGRHPAARQQCRMPRRCFVRKRQTLMLGFVRAVAADTAETQNSPKISMMRQGFLIHIENILIVQFIGMRL